MCVFTGSLSSSMHLNIQDVPVALARGVERITIVDYGGDLYPGLPRVTSPMSVWLPILKLPKVLFCWHVDLDRHSSLLEQLLWSGWQEPFTVSGVYTPGVFPLSDLTVHQFNRRDRGLVPLGDLERAWAGVQAVRVQLPAVPDRGLLDWYVEPVPLWAEHSVRSCLARKWRQSQLLAMPEEQVQLRLALHDSLGHRTLA